METAVETSLPKALSALLFLRCRRSLAVTIDPHMTFRTSFALLLLAPFTATFGRDTLSIPEAVVQTTFTETQAASPRNLVTLDAESITEVRQPSLDGLLETVPGIDARQRGPWGAQTDLSIRGGTFEQVALWVDGIRWSAPPRPITC